MARNTDTPRVLPNFEDVLNGSFYKSDRDGPAPTALRTAAVPPPPRTVPPPPRTRTIPPPAPSRSPTPRAPEYSAVQPGKRSAPPPPPSIQRSSPPPAESANFRDVGGARRSSYSDRVDIRDLLSRPPEIIRFDEPEPEPAETKSPKFHSVAPVSMSSIHLEDLPEPSKRGSRLAYTAIVAVALVAAVYVYRMQPLRAVASAATQAAPGFDNPLNGAFKNEPPSADTPAPNQALPEAIVAVGGVSYEARAASNSERSSDKQRSASKKKDTAPETTSQEATKTAERAAPPPTLEEAIMGKDRRPSQEFKADPTTTAVEAVVPAPPADSLPEFSTSQAQAALSSAASAAGSCLTAGDPSATVRVAVTFAPTGNATNSWVEGPPFAGTPQGGCIARVFRGAHVNAFSGGLITVRKTFQIP